MLVSEVIEDATNHLSLAGVTSPGVDAKWLACHVLKIDKSTLSIWEIEGREFPANQLDDFQSAIERRAKREPLQHITGLAGFRKLELEVGPGVFIPRPETEQLVEVAISKLQGIPKPLVVDFCSGSGAIAIALSTEVSGSKVYSVEISETAHSYLIRNVSKYGLDSDLVILGDVASALHEFVEQFDLVVSNPPYIPNEAVPLELEVRLHDPEIALYGGEDGLDVVRVISARALTLLKPGGHLLLEHADSQASALSELLLSSGWEEVLSLRDLAGKDRMILASKP